MSKISVPGAGGGAAGGGNPVDSRAVTGNILPDTANIYSIGASGNPFASGLFDILHLGEAGNSGIMLGHSGAGNTLTVQRGDSLVWSRVLALDFKLSTSNARLGNDGLFLDDVGEVSFSSTANESGPKDVLLTREGSGVLLLGDGASTSGAALKASGAFFTGQIWLSGLAVGDRLGTGGGNPVDSRAVTGNIAVDSDDSYSLGTQAARFTDIFAESGHFSSGVIMTAPNGSGWRVTLDNAGILQTNGPFVL